MDVGGPHKASYSDDKVPVPVVVGLEGQVRASSQVQFIQMQREVLRYGQPCATSILPHDSVGSVGRNHGLETADGMSDDYIRPVLL